MIWRQLQVKRNLLQDSDGCSRLIAGVDTNNWAIVACFTLFVTFELRMPALRSSRSNGCFPVEGQITQNFVCKQGFCDKFLTW